MKAIFILFVALLFEVTAYAQNDILFEIGARLRVTPIYLNPSPNLVIDERPLLMQQDAHLSGLSTIFGITGSLSKRISLTYRAAVRYDEFYADLSRNIPGTNAYLKRVFLDHSFTLLTELKKWDRSKLLIGLGFSSNNHNSDYSYTIFHRDPISGNQVRISTSDDFRFSTFDLPFRYQRKRFTWDLTSSITNKHRFYLQKGRFILLQLSASYMIPTNQKN